jgi:hypothetical protein
MGYLYTAWLRVKKRPGNAPEGSTAEREREIVTESSPSHSFFSSFVSSGKHGL